MSPFTSAGKVDHCPLSVILIKRSSSAGTWILFTTCGRWCLACHLVCPGFPGYGGIVVLNHRHPISPTSHRRIYSAVCLSFCSDPKDPKYFFVFKDYVSGVFAPTPLIWIWSKLNHSDPFNFKTLL